MHSILSRLKVLGDRQENSSKSFAMLHCASFLSSTQLEGDCLANAFDYIKKIVALTNQAIGDELDASQKNILAQVLEDLIEFDNIYISTRESNPDKWITLLKDKLNKRDCVYLPAGWRTIKNGHYVTLKVKKNDDGQLVLCFLNHGNGIQHHPVLSNTKTKTKRDYRSYAYRFPGVDADAVKLFAQGLLGMNNLDAHEYQFDSEDLYGLLALHGEFVDEKNRDNHQVTEQRSGTCAITNTRAAIKDVLLDEFKLEPQVVKRYEFFMKLASLVCADIALNDEVTSIDERFLQLIEIAVNELYKRLEKQQQHCLSDDEVHEIRLHMDDMTQKINALKTKMIAKDCKFEPLPEASFPLAFTIPPQNVSFNSGYANPKPLETQGHAFIARRIKPTECLNYLDSALNHFQVYLYSDNSDSSKIMKIAESIEFRRLFLYLEPPTGLDEDSYWSEIPNNHRLEVINKLCALVDLYIRLNLKGQLVTSRKDLLLFEQEVALIVYDIVAQLAIYTPELKLNNTYCFGMEDLFSKKSGFTDPERFRSFTAIANRFIQRSKKRYPLFLPTEIVSETHEIPSFSTYLLTQVPAYLESAIIENISMQTGSNFKTHLTQGEWLELYFTGQIEGIRIITNNFSSSCFTFSLQPHLPPVLGKIQYLSKLAHGYLCSSYIKCATDDISLTCFSYRKHDLDLELSLRDDYAPNSNDRYRSISTRLNKQREVLPYNLIPTDGSQCSVDENCIYQPIGTRVSKSYDRSNSPIKLPYSHAKDGQLTSGSPYDTQDESPFDEAFKSLSLDNRLAYQKKIIWLGKNIPLIYQSKYNEVMKHFFENLYTYGAIYHALDNFSATTLSLSIVLETAYEHFDNSRDENFYDWVEWLVELESNYRNWVRDFCSNAALPSSFPNAQVLLRNLLKECKKADFSRLANLLLIHYQSLNSLSLEDIPYLMAAKVGIHMDPFESNFPRPESHFEKAVLGWQDLSPLIQNMLTGMNSETLNRCLNRAIKLLALNGIFNQSSHWTLENTDLINTKSNAIISLSTGKIYVNGNKLTRNFSLAYCHGLKPYLSKRLDFDTEKEQIISVPTANPSHGCKLQCQSRTGQTYFFDIEEYHFIFKKEIKIAKGCWYATLVGEPSHTSSAPNVQKYLADRGLINPYTKDADALPPALWRIDNSVYLLMENPYNNEEAMLCDNANNWHQLKKGPSGWEKTGLVLLNTNNPSLLAVKSWNTYFSRLIHNITLHVWAKETQGSFLLTELSIDVLGLNFYWQDNRLFARDFPGFYLSEQQGYTGLNGFKGIIILENGHGEQKHLLPKGQFSTPAGCIYVRNPTYRAIEGYHTLSKDRLGRIKGKSPEASILLAVLYAVQGDFKHAILALHDSISHKVTSFEMYNTVDNYRDLMPNTPHSFAFYLHLHYRLKQHERKWGQEEPPEKNHIYKRIDEKAREAELNLRHCLSTSREGVVIIPDYLLFTMKHSALDEDFKEQPFMDSKYCSIDYINLSDISRLAAVGLATEAEPNFNFFPPIKFEVCEDFKSWAPSSHLAKPFRNLFELAISTNPIDSQRLHCYLYRFVHSHVRALSSIDIQVIATLRYIADNPEDFRNWQQTKPEPFSLLKSYRDFSPSNKPNLIVAISNTLKRKCNGSDLSINSPFSGMVTAQAHKTLIPRPHWLRPKASAHARFALDIERLNSIPQQPLSKVLADCFSEEKIDIGTYPLPKRLDFSCLNEHAGPITQKIIANYEQGYAESLRKVKTKYTLLQGISLETVAMQLSTALNIVSANLQALQNKILEKANQLSDNLEDSSQVDMIHAARATGELTKIDIKILMQCILRQDVRLLTTSNPHLTQTDITLILSQTCELALLSSKADQIKEALGLMPESPMQMLGEVLAKKRQYQPSAYPELLVYEYATGRMLREGQAVNIIKLIELIESADKSQYQQVLLQFAAGGGKTAVLIPILAQRFARKGFLPVIMNTEELYGIAEQEIPDNLKTIFGQNLEIIDKSLDYQWDKQQSSQLLTDLKSWQALQKCVLLKSVSWHSLHIAYKKALQSSDEKLKASLKAVLDYFNDNCVVLEDECHLISDPLKNFIQTNSPSQAFKQENTQLILEFYQILTSQNPDDMHLVTQAGVSCKSKKAVTAEEMKTIQQALAEKIVGSQLFSSIDAQTLIAYLLAKDPNRPEWLLQLKRDNSDLADNIILARTFIKTLWPHIATLQYGKDYGKSIHPNDNTVAPKHDGQDVTSHFADPVLVLALSAQMIHQQGVPEEAILKLFERLLQQHHQERQNANALTNAEIQIIHLLPKAYLENLNDVRTLNLKEFAKDSRVQFHPTIIDYYLEHEVFPQIKLPTQRIESTAADLQSGVKRRVLFSATPGLAETYPVKLNHLLLDPTFEALVVSTLLSPANNKGIVISATSTPEAFFDELKTKAPEEFANIMTLIDRGGLLIGRNAAISQALLNTLGANLEKASTLFFNEEGKMELSSRARFKDCIINGTDIKAVLDAEGVGLEEALIFLILDLAHTTGTDVKRPYKDRALLTIGKEQCFSDTIQAALRERQLLRENAQTIIGVITEALLHAIDPDMKTYDLNRILLWMIENQAKKDEHRVLARAYQGLEELVYLAAKNQFLLSKGLTKSMNLSFWDCYEQPQTTGKTNAVLDSHFISLCLQYGVNHLQISKDILDWKNTLITQTEALIPEILAPINELNTQVVYEVKHTAVINQEQKQKQQQQKQQQKQTMRSEYHGQKKCRLMLEIYRAEDTLDRVFEKNSPQYRKFTLPKCDSLSTPEILINLRHFSPVQVEDDTTICYLKPIDNVLIRFNTDGSYQYLAMTAGELKHYHLSILNSEPSSPQYLVVSGEGEPLISSLNLNSQAIKDLRNSESYQDTLSYISIVNGQIYNPEQAAAMIKRYGINEMTYKQIVQAIKLVHIADTPIDLDKQVYFRHLCGWECLDTITTNWTNKRKTSPMVNFRSEWSVKRPHRMGFDYVGRPDDSKLHPEIIGGDKESKVLVHKNSTYVDRYNQSRNIKRREVTEQNRSSFFADDHSNNEADAGCDSSITNRDRTSARKKHKGIITNAP